MTSATDIANIALSHLGAERIGDLADNTRSARAMNARYTHTRDLELSSHPWRFAVRRVKLPALTGPAPWEFPHRYARPADDLRPLRLGEHTVAPDRGIRQVHTIVGREIHTVLGAPLPYEYVSRDVPEDDFPPLFREVLALRLAMSACVEITQSDALGQRLAALLRDTESEARRTNAMWSGARSRPIGPWLGARG